jgi:dynactin 1
LALHEIVLALFLNLILCRPFIFIRQRKREEDFSRTVGNYRSTVETLKKEKEALMELQQGGEGEKSSLLASSQKALARAAQLVSDAADTRKREALAALDYLDAQSQKHLAERLEKMLPKGIVAPELAAVKGELLASRIAGLAAGSLDGIASSFHNNLRGVVVDAEATIGSEGSDATLVLSDESKQAVANMIHQSECAHVLIATSSDAIKLLAAGQWPDLLSEQASLDLGSLIGLTMPELEVMLRRILKSLKEEGVIDTHQSHVDALRQIAKNAKLQLEGELYNHEKAGEKTLSPDWKPPGMELIEHVTNVKFSCLGAAAAVAVSCKDDSSIGPSGAHLKRLLVKLDSLSNEASQLCLRLASLDVQKSNDISTLSSGTGNLRTTCDEVLSNVRKALLEVDEGITAEMLRACDASVEEAIKQMSKVSSVFRASKLNNHEPGVFHPLSPETKDSWSGLTRLAKRVRSIDGDEEDTNYLMRARSIEHRLADAVANEPKLLLANSKVSSLEKVSLLSCPIDYDWGMHSMFFSSLVESCHEIKRNCDAKCSSLGIGEVACKIKCQTISSEN